MESGGAVELKLHGTWGSPYVQRVKLALELKGLRYEYVEEDLSDKTPELLLHNPVHKKVPVLVHRGRPLAESLVILEYIDEAWPDAHPLLPRDPYERAVIRFWCHFFTDQMAASSMAIFQKTGEELKAATERFLADVGVIEKELREGFFKGRKFFGGEEMGLLDILFGCGSQWFPVLEECSGVKLTDGRNFPRLSSVIASFNEHDAAKRVFPDREKLVEFAKAARRRMVQGGAPKILIAAQWKRGNMDAQIFAHSDGMVLR